MLLKMILARRSAVTRTLFRYQVLRPLSCLHACETTQHRTHTHLSRAMPPHACTMPAESSHGIGFGPRRSKSGIAGDNLVDIDEVIELSSTPKKGTFLVDVRNKHEMGYGIIPSAVNIPLPELIEALQLDDEDFENEYGVKKFNKDDRVIFYCRSGVRSTSASAIASQMGYERTYNYQGSWLEWAERFNLPTY